MKFKIDFNYDKDSSILEVFGAIKENGTEGYYINLGNFEDLNILLNNVEKCLNHYYGAIVEFNPPTIYLDSSV